MGVVVNEAGQDQLAVEMDDAGVAFADEFFDFFGGAHPNDAVAADGHRRRFGRFLFSWRRLFLFLQRPDLGVQQDDMGGTDGNRARLFLRFLLLLLRPQSGGKEEKKPSQCQVRTHPREALLDGGAVSSR